jgi:hypothetical protein
VGGRGVLPRQPRGNVHGSVLGSAQSSTDLAVLKNTDLPVLKNADLAVPQILCGQSFGSRKTRAVLRSTSMRYRRLENTATCSIFQYAVRPVLQIDVGRIGAANSASGRGSFPASALPGLPRILSNRREGGTAQPESVRGPESGPLRGGCRHACAGFLGVPGRSAA